MLAKIFHGLFSSAPRRVANALIRGGPPLPQARSARNSLDPRIAQRDAEAATRFKPPAHQPAAPYQPSTPKALSILERLREKAVTALIDSINTGAATRRAAKGLPPELPFARGPQWMPPAHSQTRNAAGLVIESDSVRAVLTSKAKR